MERLPALTQCGRSRSLRGSAEKLRTPVNDARSLRRSEDGFGIIGIIRVIRAIGVIGAIRTIGIIGIIEAIGAI